MIFGPQKPSKYEPFEPLGLVLLGLLWAYGFLQDQVKLKHRRHRPSPTIISTWYMDPTDPFKGRLVPPVGTAACRPVPFLLLGVPNFMVCRSLRPKWGTQKISWLLWAYGVGYSWALLQIRGVYDYSPMDTSSVMNMLMPQSSGTYSDLSYRDLEPTQGEPTQTNWTIRDH